MTSEFGCHMYIKIMKQHSNLISNLVKPSAIGPFTLKSLNSEIGILNNKNFQSSEIIEWTSIPCNIYSVPGIPVLSFPFCFVDQNL